MRSWALIFVVCTVAMLSGRGLVYPVNSRVAGKSHTPKPENFFSREQIHRGKTYRNENRIAFIFGVLIRLSAMAILLATGLGGLLRDRLSQICGHRRVLTALLLLSAILILNSAISFPVSLYSGYFHEHTYGMSTQGLAGWFLDYGKVFLVHLVVIVPIGLGLRILIQQFPRTWWLSAWLGFGVVLILLVHLAPLVIDPLFHSFKSLQDQTLNQRALQLAKRANLKVEAILEMDASRRTRHRNAYFTGLGNSKRIVLYDTLLQESTVEEAELILAHEIGHWKHRHIWKGIGLGFVSSLILLFIAHRSLEWAIIGGRFGISKKEDPLALVLILLLVTGLSFLSMPIQNAISRSFEREADEASLLLTRQPDVFIKAEKNLAIANLTDVNPWWGNYMMFYCHPTTMERIEMALNFKKEEPGADGERLDVKE